MKSSQVRQWLEQQEAIHGDLDVGCMTAFGNVAEGEILTITQLAVTTQSMLPFKLNGVESDAKVIAIGCGDCK